MLRFLLYFNAFTDAFRRPLSESSIVGNRGKRSVITPHNKRERPFKRPRTNSQPSSSPMPSSQASISASDASSPPPSQTFQDASYSPPGNQEVNEEALDADSIEESLKDISNNFFEDIELLDDLSPFSPYLRPPQPSARLRRYITRHPYTEERERHYSSLINIYEGICSESSKCRQRYLGKHRRIRGSRLDYWLTTRWLHFCTNWCYLRWSWFLSNDWVLHVQSDPLHPQ